ncbi:peptidoglycan-binding protein [Candidatus Gracilibacteria bacterium]|nr:peptidoglycan-binding protein [Candidatus Gracilibacteria bacterium]
MSKTLIIGLVVALLIFGAFRYKKMKESSEGDAPTLFGKGKNNATTYPIKYGQKGTLVRALQQRLNNRGANLRVDGDYGAKTKAAVTQALKTDGTTVSFNQFNSLPSGGSLSVSGDSVVFAARFNAALKSGETSSLIALFEQLLSLNTQTQVAYIDDTEALYNLSFLKIISEIKPANINEEIVVNRMKKAIAFNKVNPFFM